MFPINNYPIHDVNERCILPTKKRLNHNIVNNYQDLYGDQSQYRERFNDLGIPIFVVQLNNKGNMKKNLFITGKTV